MAKAYVIGIEQGYLDTDNKARLEFGVLYTGSDVPGTFFRQSYSVTVTDTTTLAQLASSIAAEVRAQATNNGFSVAANQVFVPSYQGA